MKNSNKVLMVAPYFLPRRRVGAYRPFKFAIHLREFGWEPVIMSIEDSRGKLTARERSLLKEIEVYELSPPLDLTYRSGSQIGESSDKNKEKLRSDNAAVSKNGGGSLMQSVIDLVDSIFPVDTWLPFFYLKKNEMFTLCRQEQPDIIWATGDPWSGLWIGKKVADKFDLPFVADFRDPWTLCSMRKRKRSKAVQKLDRRVEKKILRKAAAVIFTAETTTSIYENTYPYLKGKTHTIYNSFDPVLYRGEVDGKTSSRHKNDDSLRVTFFGKFRKLSPAKPVIEILKTLEDREPGLARAVKIHCFGPLSGEDARLAQKHGLKDQFVIEEPVPPEKSLSKLREADLLLLSTDVRRKEIIPAKLWDYLAAKRPILSIAPNNEIGEILNKTGAGVQFSQDDAAGVAALLAECVRAKRVGERIPISIDFNTDRINQYESRHATRRLADIFNKLVR